MDAGLRREFFRYISLNTMGMIGLSCYILADTFFVANRLGAQGLAALNIAISIFGLVNGLGLMLGMGGGIRYTLMLAQGRDREGGKAFFAAASFGLALGLFFLILGQAAATPLAQLLGAKGEILPLCAGYLRVLLSFSPFFILNQVCIAFVRNDGSPRLAMCSMLMGSLANIVLDYVFLYPLNLGMGGAALATGVAPVLGLCISSTHLLGRRGRLRPVPHVPSPRLLGNLSALGVSALLNEVSSSVILVTFNLIILSLTGDTGVAAYGVVANLALVVTAVFTGISQGVQPLLSRTCGQGNAPQTRSLLKLALGVAGGLSILLVLGVLVWADPLAAIFNESGDTLLQTMAREGLRLYFPAYLFAGCNIVLASAFSATGRPGPAFGLSLFRGCVGVLLVVFPLSALGGMTGVWLTVPVVELLALLGGGFLAVRTGLTAGGR